MRSESNAPGAHIIAPRGSAPVTEGKRPRSWVRSLAAAIAPTVLAALTAASILSSGCSQTNETRTVGPYTLAITESTPAAVPAMGESEGIYQVQTTVVLPLIDRPKDLTGDKVKPYPRALWYTSSSLQMQLTYVLTNLGKTDTTVEVLVDGFNEFVQYVPVAHVDEEGTSVDASMVDRRVIVPANGRVTGTVSYDDFERMAMALAIIENGVLNPFHVVEPHTDLFTDQATKPFIPTQIDGLTGFNISLRSSGATKVALEATLELIDHSGLLVDDGTATKARPPTTIINPTVAEPPM